MGPLRLLFDSNILITALNGKPSTEIIKLLGGDYTLYISFITWIEVLTKPIHEERTRMFLDRFSRLGITDEIAERAVLVRREMRLKTPDALIYATALETGRTLVTLNTRDFPPGTPSVLTPI